ncbi:hypothetical protein [Leptolyngbya sp. FACHB-261]|uniref:hypothetical protein n=1 Tax=Leptolyngbya sp. FACHB-261 TaxID=2692806 RepID=UPI0016861236|nr:hypothetical protein [Leptolyngbya sp. FACHB-261]MBD2099602.1 hypothetical protein [Leptolyngbya sp. FACHB-261]
MDSLELPGFLALPEVDNRVSATLAAYANQFPGATCEVELRDCWASGAVRFSFNHPERYIEIGFEQKRLYGLLESVPADDLRAMQKEINALSVDFFEFDGILIGDPVDSLFCYILNDQQTGWQEEVPANAEQFEYIAQSIFEIWGDLKIHPEVFTKTVWDLLDYMDRLGEA